VDGGEIVEPQWAISAFVVLPLLIMLVFSWFFQAKISESKERLIQAQQDTIHKLLNREPVTYAEVGTKPTKKATDVYAAWGSQMVNIDEDEQHS
jgi:hypothetical protein